MEQGEPPRQVSGALLIRSSSLIIPETADNGEYVFWSRVEPDAPENLLACGCLYLMADGQGNDGIQACQKVLRDISAAYYQKNDLSVSQRLQSIIQATGDKLYLEFAMSGVVDGTVHLTAVVVIDNHIYIANAGANRAYLIHDGETQQITRDPNQLSELLRQGIVIVEEAQEAVGKNRLVHRLGDHPNTQLDLYENIPVFSGDIFLLCNEAAALQLEEVPIGFIIDHDDPAIVCSQIAALGKPPEPGENQTLLAIVFSKPDLPFPLSNQAEVIASGSPDRPIRQTSKPLDWSLWQKIISRKAGVILAAVLVFLMLILFLSKVFEEKERYPADFLVSGTAPVVSPSELTIVAPSITFTLPAQTNENETPSVELRILTSAPTTGLTITSPTITTGPLTAYSELACVWEVNSGDSLFSTIRKFQVPYRASDDYYFFEDCDLEREICQGTKQEIQSHGSIEPGWFIVIPVDNQESCQLGSGAWVIVQR